MGADLPDSSGWSHRQHPDDQGCLLGHPLQGYGRQEFRGGRGLHSTGKKNSYLSREEGRGQWIKYSIF